MKKIFSILLLLTFLINCTGIVYAEPTGEPVLSDIIRVDGTQSVNRYVELTTDEKNSGDYSIHVYSTSSGPDFGQVYTVPNLPAGEYTVTWYAKGDDGTISFWSNWDENVYNINITPEVQTNGWKKYTETLYIDGNDDTEYIFCVESAVDCYMDDISLVDANGINYIFDGGFEGDTGGSGNTGGDNPGGDDNTGDVIEDDKLILSNTTNINKDNTDTMYAKVTATEKHGGSYSLHYKAGAEDDLQVTQNFETPLEAGEEYVMTVYAKPVTGRLWFRVNWDFTGWMVVSTDNYVEAPDSDGWAMYQKTFTVSGDDLTTNLLITTDQNTEFYIDDISLVKAVGGAENLVPDGGFEEVSIKDDSTGGDDNIGDGDNTGGDDNTGDGDNTGGDDNTGSEEDTTGAHDRYKNDLEFKDITGISGANGSTCCAVPTEDEFHGEDGYSLHFKAGEKDDLQVTQELETPLEAGEEYVMTVYAKSVSGIVYFRVDWDKTAWMAISPDSAGVADSDGWVMYQQTFTVTGDKKTTHLLINNDQNGGNAEIYIDDISLVKVGAEENLVPDGGFDDVKVTPAVIPDYDVLAPVLKKGTEIADAISGAGTYTVTVAAKNNALETALPVELLVAVFDSTGVLVDLYSDSAAVEKSEPRANDTVLSVSFEASEGYSAEVYVMNDRQNIDVYSNPVKY